MFSFVVFESFSTSLRVVCSSESAGEVTRGERSCHAHLVNFLGLKQGSKLKSLTFATSLNRQSVWISQECEERGGSAQNKVFGKVYPALNYTKLWNVLGVIIPQTHIDGKRAYH